MTQSRAKIAIIGTGWWATASHIPALLENHHAELVALCDANPEKALAAAATCGHPRTYTNHNELLAAEKPDGVIVATTHATHFVVASDCLKAGAHLLVEKPLTLHASEARELIELAKKHNIALLMGYPWHYTSQVQEVRETIASGKIGAIQYVQCTFNSFCIDLLRGIDTTHRSGGYPVHGPGDVYSKKEHSGGGHGHLQMTHAAGLLFYVTGLRLRSLRAQMQNLGLAVDVVNAMVAEFEGNSLGIIGGTSNAFLSRMGLQIYGAKGAIDMDMHAGTARLRYADGTYEEFSAGDDIYPQTAPSSHLVAIARGEESPVVIEAGWHAVELLDAAYRSAEAGGRPINVEELYS